MLVNLKEILSIAEKNGTAVGMFNATGLDTLQAEIAAAEELDVPVIVAHAEVHNIYNDISMIGPAMVEAARNAKVPVCVHLDHGVSLEMVYRAFRLGFTSVMYDASALPYEENVANTQKVVEIARALGVSVEAELGRLVTAEAGGEASGLENAKPSDFYTNPDEAKDFVARTKVDALAIAFGTSHGFYNAPPVLDFTVIEKVRKATDGMPLVMHGGSGVSDEGYKKAIKAGIRKINYYSYMSKAGYDAAERVIKSGKTHYLHDVIFEAKNAMKLDVMRALKLFSNQ